jgi:trehalose 6-phosphate synthase/phosphatase
MMYVILQFTWLFFFCPLILFYFQGTLSPIVKVPSAAIPSETTLEALEKLSADPQNLVYIISGRDSAFLEQHLGHLKNIGFSAEHGGFFRERGSEEWTNLTKSLDMSWMSEVEEIFRYYTEVCFYFVTVVVRNVDVFSRGRQEVISR